MRKIASMLLAAVTLLTFPGAPAFATSTSDPPQMIEELQTIEEAQTIIEAPPPEEPLPTHTENIFDCPTIPEPMQPGSVIEYIDNSHIKIVSGGFLSDDYTKYLSEPGMYAEPFKGLIIDYADDGLIGHFKLPEDVFDCPTIPEPMQPGSVIEYLNDTHVKIIEGGFQSSDYTKYLSEPGVYVNPVKGLTIDYADDGLIGHFKFPEGMDVPKPSKPEGFKARASKKSDTITLTWKKSEMANGYKVYRSTKKNGTYKLIKKLKSGDTLRYNDKGLVKGRTYYYKLVPYLDYHSKIINGPRTPVVKGTVRN